jgi:DNA-binding NarL/FixJ family response regulator
MARGLLALRRRHLSLARAGAPPEVGERQVRSARGPYRLRATYLGPHLFPPAEFLVEVEPLFRVPLEDRELHDASALTRREIEVARLLARGAPNRTVAGELGISTHTARHQKESVLRKLGVASRTQVAARISRG